MFLIKHDAHLKEQILLISFGFIQLCLLKVFLIELLNTMCQKVTKIVQSVCDK